MARAAVLAEAELGRPMGKTANGLVLHSVADDVVAVIDSTNAGRDAGQVVAKRDVGIPVVASLDEALAIGIERLYIGVANVGGYLPPVMHDVVPAALRAGVHVISGLHIFLSEVPEFAAAAQESGATITDIRRPPTDLRVADGSLLDRTTPRILVMGMDCDIGKRVTAMELLKAARDAGRDPGFVATGQTGCMLAPDAGTVIDRVPADFAAGQVERMARDVSDMGRDVVIGYGQASIRHPAFSAVAIAVLHGFAPDAVILQVAPGRRQRVLFDHPKYLVGNVLEEIALIEALGSTRVVALAVNPSEAADARQAIMELEARTGLPAVDPLTGDPMRLWQAAWKSCQRNGAQVPARAATPPATR